MRTELAEQLSDILDNGNFQSEVKKNVTINNKEYKSIVVLNHEEISSGLACQHIQDFISEDIDCNDGVWLFNYGLENVNELKLIKEDNQTILY